MSLYNMLFGMNGKSDLLLAVIGFRKNDVERFRDCSVSEDGKRIEIYTRTGGGNRADYPQISLYKSPHFVSTADDDFDSTYATFYFNIPARFIKDVSALNSVLDNGFRKGFAKHLKKTLNRVANAADEHEQKYQSEEYALKNQPYVKANGHTFVPYTDGAMLTALECAEKNGGKLLTCWGILPLKLTVVQNNIRFPNAKMDSVSQSMDRVRIDYDWKIDTEYWERCIKRFSDKYPLSMANITASVEQYLTKETT